MREYSHCIHTDRGQGWEYIFEKVRIHNSEIIPQKYLPVFAQVRIQAPHVFAQKLIPRELFLHVSVLCRGVMHQQVWGGVVGLGVLTPDMVVSISCERELRVVATFFPCVQLRWPAIRNANCGN